MEDVCDLYTTSKSLKDILIREFEDPLTEDQCHSEPISHLPGKVLRLFSITGLRAEPLMRFMTSRESHFDRYIEYEIHEQESGRIIRLRYKGRTYTKPEQITHILAHDAPQYDPAHSNPRFN